MKTAFSVFLLMLSLPALTAAARDWEKIPIPGAVCGNGDPYSIFLSMKDPSRVTFEFQGGGACWNRPTCAGDFPLANISAPEAPPAHHGGFESDSPLESPISSETLIFVPYCTGDVYAGNHVAHYGPDTDIHHEGSQNFKKALEKLNQGSQIDLEHLASLTLYGASAGAIGALLHSATISPYLGNSTRKYLVADSPGLHWGKRFWKKFPQAFRDDMQQALNPLHMILNPADGNLAQQLPILCNQLFDWQIAILQADEDFIMSAVFGNITPRKHARKVHGPLGLATVTGDSGDAGNNCSSWIPHSFRHTFMLENHSAAATAGGISALEYVTGELSDRGGVNYIDILP